MRDATAGTRSRSSRSGWANSSVGFALGTYAHVLPSADVETANTLARHILGDRTS